MTEITPITLTRAQLLHAAALSGLPVTDDSPLSGLQPAAGAPGPADLAALRAAGWLATGGLTQAARSTLESLCRPNLHARLLMGSRDMLGVVDAYSAQGLANNSLVTFAALPENDQYRLVPKKSLSVLADALAKQVLSGPLDGASFHAAPDIVEFVTLLAILDAHVDIQLRAMLVRQKDVPTLVTAHSLREMLVRGLTADDLGWAVTAFASIFPFVDYDLDEARLATSLAGLAAGGLVSAVGEHRYTPAQPLLDLCSSLLPLVGYGALHLERRSSGGSVQAKYLAFLRGPMTVVVAQPVVNEQDRRVMELDCVDAIGLADILFDLGLPDSRLQPASKGVEAAAAGTTCPGCGTTSRPGSKFCPKCGAALVQLAAHKPPATAPPSAPVNCPVCHAAIKPGRKFCTACGAPLSAPVQKAEVR